MEACDARVLELEAKIRACNEEKHELVSVLKTSKLITLVPSSFLTRVVLTVEAKQKQEQQTKDLLKRQEERQQWMVPREYVGHYLLLTF